MLAATKAATMVVVRSGGIWICFKGFNDGLAVVCGGKEVKDGSKVSVGPNSNDEIVIY